MTVLPFLSVLPTTLSKLHATRLTMSPRKFWAWKNTTNRVICGQLEWSCIYCKCSPVPCLYSFLSNLYSQTLSAFFLWTFVIVPDFWLTVDYFSFCGTVKFFVLDMFAYFYFVFLQDLWISSFLQQPRPAYFSRNEEEDKVRPVRIPQCKLFTSV